MMVAALAARASSVLFFPVAILVRVMFLGVRTSRVDLCARMCKDQVQACMGCAEWVCVS